MNKLRQQLRQGIRLNHALRFVWRSDPRWVIANSIIITLQGILPLGVLYSLKLLIDTVTESLQNNTSVDSRHIAQLIILVGVIALLEAIIRSIAGLLHETQTLIVTDYMRTILHTKSIEIDLEYYENPAYHDTLHRAQQEAAYRPPRILYGLLNLGRGSITLITLGGLLFSLHFAITVILIVVAVPGLIVRLLYSRRLYEWQRQRTHLERESWQYDWLISYPNYAKELRLYNLGMYLIERFSTIRSQLRQDQMQFAVKRSSAELLASAVAVAATTAAYGLIIRLALQGRITIGDLFLYYQAFQRGQAVIQDVLTSLASLYEDNLFLINLDEFLNLQPRVVEPAQPAPMPQPMQRGVELTGIAFTYPGSDQPVLHNINLRLRPGEVIALVGHNGAGKTTLIKLLCRLYDPTAGHITLDDIDIRNFRVADLRHEFGVIFQDYARYNMTAQENIGFGQVEALQNTARVTAAAIRAGVHDTIQALPKGYDTMLGKMFHEGVELSIGQWQKIALARAFMRDAQILVLDEPSSALDPAAEYEIFQRFGELFAGKSAIIISHRLSTVKMADCIYVLKDGTIVERGSHDELMALKGEYYTLFEMQAQSYR